MSQYRWTSTASLMSQPTLRLAVRTRRPRTAPPVLATAFRARTCGRGVAVGFQPLFQCLTGAVEADHCIVRGEAELPCSLGDGNAIDDHTTQDTGVLGLESFCLNEHAPAIDGRVIINGGKLEFVDGQHRGWSTPKLIHEDIPNDAPEPSFGTSRVPQLVSGCQCARDRVLDELIRIHRRPGAAAHERDQPSTLGHNRRVNDLCRFGDVRNSHNDR